MTAALIGIDWGTSSFRAWLMGADGALLDSVAEGPGILAVPGGDFEAALEGALGSWLDTGAPVIASGMIGSRNGWVETPYLALPLDAQALAGALVPHRTARGRTIHFVPGAASDPDGPRPDVMRGEETEIIGHLAAGGGDGVLVLPGTHSKWARIAQGRLTGFSTCMTGEVFALLRDRSILGRLAADGPPAPAAFARGVEASRLPGALLSRVFSARTLALFDRLAPQEISDFLSGMLIGDEVAAGLAVRGRDGVTIIGSGDLAERYRVALAAFGVDAAVAAPGMARPGLREIAMRAGVGA